MSFELVAAEEAHYPKALMCRALGSPAPVTMRFARAGHRDVPWNSSNWMCKWRRSSAS